MSAPPPPPPPHGSNPKTTNTGPNLPPGKYDIFIIPPHSSGSGFLYLPSLKPNVNSFAAGFASALVLVILFHSIGPAFRVWWNGFQGMGNMGMVLLVIAVGVGAWAFGRAQQEGGHGFAGGSGGSWNGWGPNSGGYPGAHPGGSTHNAGPTPDAGSPPPPPPHGSPPPQSGPPPNATGGGGPRTSWQQQQQRPETEEAPKGSWEKAREETRRKEEERRAKEAEQRRKEEVAKRLKELREKEARERARREKEAKEKQEQDARERAKREQEAKAKQEQEARERSKREQEIREKVERESREKAQREKEQREKDAHERQRERDAHEKARRDKEQRESRLREARERELRERLEKERAIREKLEREAKERENIRIKETEAAAAQAKQAEASRKSTYAFSGVGERTNPWPNGKPSPQPASPKPASPTKPNPTPPPSANRAPPPPTARTADGEEDTYSYRPYDQPKPHNRRKSGETIFTESSYAPSHTTARTTPPPSMRGPYTTKDPDKIVIKAVYGFLNQFSKTPASQLISGVGSVTDGLILRITTEGLFIDDDVRGVPQREWDVKAWTLKLMEVWCPSHCFKENNATPRAPQKAGPPRFKLSSRTQSKVMTGDDADTFLTDLLYSCKDECRLGAHGGSDAGSSYANSAAQSGEWKHRGLHVLRATIRDQEGKRFMFVLGEEEGWKVAVGLQRLRKGTQVRQLGIQHMPPLESKNTLEMLGW
ncbi:hypothetical protein F4780DRAFT_551608 [Xylariomycetidae sp. FL0641]|nr:hypothetical protein F4780DRAFT_551608 [Xylariomycetidae sp. FL0641]